MDILIIRHTKVNSPFDVLYGHHDVPLADTFEEEAKNVKNRLKRWFPFDVCYSSPLSRALKLGQFLHNGEITIDNRLMEINFGDWEMKTWSEIPDFDEWMKNPIKPPNGETYVDLTKRFKEFFNELVEQKPGHKILITSHSGIIRCAISLLTGVPMEKIFTFTVEYGGALHISVNEYSDEWLTLLPKVILPDVAVKGFNI